MPDDGLQSSPKAVSTQEDFELQVMTSEHDATTAAAPLIPNDAEHEGQDGDLDGGSYENARTGSYGSWFIWVLTFSAGISGLLFGYDTGVISSTLVSIGSDLSNRPLKTLDKSLITSCTSLFALVASPIAGLLADKYGRKKVILVADAFFVLGALWQAVTASVWGMIFGRSIVGLAIGGASLVVPLYISELSPSHLRGRLVTVSILFVTGGQVVAYLIGWTLSTIPRGWRWMVGLGAVPAILQFAMLVFRPETPRWLMKANCADEARRVVRKVYGVGYQASRIVEQIVRGIEKEILEEEEAKAQRTGASSATKSKIPRLIHPSDTTTELFAVRGNRRALTIACMLQALQQLCGFNSLMYFSATIFSILRFSSPTLISLSVAVTNFLFTLLACALIDRIGRRRILLYSIPIMTAALLLCALAFSFLQLPKAPARASATKEDEGRLPLPPLMVLLSLIIYVASYALGLGNVPWQQSELFPLNVRSLGSSLATATNWGCNFVIGLTFLPMLESLSPGWTFVSYAIVCVVGWVSTWDIYPEMSGLSLEEVGALLDSDGWGVEKSLRRVRERNQ